MLVFPALPLASLAPLAFVDREAAWHGALMQSAQAHLRVNIVERESERKIVRDRQIDR